MNCLPRKRVADPAIVLSIVAAMCSQFFFTPKSGAAEVTLDNGVAGDGHLSITLDEFGTYGDAFQNGPEWVDFFDPSPDPVEGQLPERFATFSNVIYFFVDPSGVGDGTHRVAASTHAGILATYPDPTLDCQVVVANSTTNLPTSTSSLFRCTGSGVDFTVALTQSVSLLTPGPASEARAQLEQEYAITNNGPGINLIMNRHTDQDMPWGGGVGAPAARDDLPGVDFAELGRPQIYAQDRELTTAALVIRTREDMEKDPLTTATDGGVSNYVYYVGKGENNLPAPPGNTDFPGGNCPTHNVGTDVQVWDNFGVPNCWKNFIPGVGYNVPGITPQTNFEAFMGMQTEANIPSGQTYAIAFQSVYGFRPEPTLTIPPSLTTQTVEYGPDGCGEFLWTLKNVNPTIPGETPIAVGEFFIDVEAGDGAQTCSTMTPPTGWSTELCAGPDGNGHLLYRFFGGTPIAINSEVKGRFRVDTNGGTPTTNPLTNTAVPALSVVLHTAQFQDEAECNFNFGPARNGEWGIRVNATAFLPVPAMSLATKLALTMIVVGGGVVLLRGRSHRAVPI